MSPALSEWCITVEEVVGEPCKGRLYRCRVTWYQKPSTGAYVNTVEFRPLKSLSCPGCQRCEWYDEFIRESDNMFGLPDHPEDGAVYRLEVTYSSYDYETDSFEPEAVGFVLEPRPDDE